MQVAAYGSCLMSMGYEDIVGAIIVWTNSKNKSGIEGLGSWHMGLKELQQELDDYRDISKVWERNFGTKKPIIRQIPGFITLGAEHGPEREVIDGAPGGKGSKDIPKSSGDDTKS